MGFNLPLGVSLADINGPPMPRCEKCGEEVNDLDATGLCEDCAGNEEAAERCPQLNPYKVEAWEAKRIEKLPEFERTPEELASLKAHKDAVFLANRHYDYQDDWDEQNS